LALDAAKKSLEMLATDKSSELRKKGIRDNAEQKIQELTK